MKKFLEKLKSIKPSTYARCIALVVVLINQCLAVFGTTLPFTSSLVYQIISAVLTIIVGIWAAWKNNDITTLAQTAGKVFDALKDGTITTDEANSLLESADALVTADDEDEDEDDEYDDTEDLAAEATVE